MAGLSTVRQYYERLSNARCIAVGERNELRLPSMTFGSLGETYLERSRTDRPGAWSVWPPTE